MTVDQKKRNVSMAELLKQNISELTKNVLKISDPLDWLVENKNWYPIGENLPQAVSQRNLYKQEQYSRCAGISILNDHGRNDSSSPH